MADGALAQYETMRAAVAVCARIDEAAQILDKAEALRAYARQSADRELERWVAEIKCRAAVRLGELSRALDTAPAGRPKSNASQQRETLQKADVLKEAGISTSSAQRYEQLAEPTRAEAYYADCKAGARAPSLKELRHVLKQDARDTRERALGVKQRALPIKKFGVLYADPPWRFEPYSRVTGMDRAADNHYPTMSLDALCDLGERIPAADDAVLFLWATVPMLPAALRVMSAWGFTYKSNFVWVKDKLGTGYWNRNQHELLLVGTRGAMPAPAPGDQYASVIRAPLRAHSSKPFAVIEMIDGMFPSLEGLELFAREPAGVGWTVWGLEAPDV